MRRRAITGFGWYRGWTMVALGALMVMLTVGSVTYAYGIYVTPVSADMGFSRATINTGLVFQHLGSALVAPFAGRLLDRFPIRPIVAVAGVSLGGALILLGVGDVLWTKALLIVLPLSFGFQAAGSVASYVLVARWFRLQRGRAMALVAIGQTASSVVMAPIIAALIQAFGWRQAIAIQGTGVMLVLLLIAWLIVERPADGEAEPAGKVVPTIAPSGTVERHDGPLPYRVILANPVFWLLAIITALTLAVVQATLASLVPLATSRGLGLLEATTLLSSLGLSGMTGKLVLAYVADRIDRRTLLVGALVLILGFTLSLTVDFGARGLLIASIACGIAIGSFFPIYSAMLSDRFGGASLGTTEGLVAPLIATLSAVAIWAAGVSFDATGGYRQIFQIFAGVLAFALVLALGLRFSTGTRLRTSPAGAA